MLAATRSSRRRAGKKTFGKPAVWSLALKMMPTKGAFFTFHSTSRGDEAADARDGPGRPYVSNRINLQYLWTTFVCIVPRWALHSHFGGKASTTVPNWTNCNGYPISVFALWFFDCLALKRRQLNSIVLRDRVVNGTPSNYCLL